MNSTKQIEAIATCKIANSVDQKTAVAAAKLDSAIPAGVTTAVRTAIVILAMVTALVGVFFNTMPKIPVTTADVPHHIPEDIST